MVAENQKRAVQEQVDAEKTKRRQLKAQIEELKQKNREAQTRIDTISKDIEVAAPKKIRIEADAGSKLAEFTKLEKTHKAEQVKREAMRAERDLTEKAKLSKDLSDI